MKRIAVALMLLLLCDMTSIAAQDIPSSNTNAVFNNQCTIPFQKLYKLLIVKATINGIPGYLCIDTGIEGLVINEKYFRKSGQGETLKSIGGRSVEVGQAHASVELACLSMDFKDVMVLNIDHLVPHDNIPVLGLVGWAFFGGFDLHIDFRNKEFRVFEPGLNKLDSHFSKASILTMPLRFIGSVPVVQAKLGNMKLNLILDTGATVNVLNKSSYNNLKPHCNTLGKVKVREWSDQVTEVLLTSVSGMQLGEVVLNPMNTVWRDLASYNGDSETFRISGVIGQELMKQYLLVINFSTLKIEFYNYDDVQLKVDVIQTIESVHQMRIDFLRTSTFFSVTENKTTFYHSYTCLRTLTSKIIKS